MKIVEGTVPLRSGPPPQRVGKISQFVIDSLSMTEGDARKSKEKSHSSLLFHLILCFMANKTEKAFTTFVAFDSDDAKKILEEKKSMEFPQLTTLQGKGKLQRLIKWEAITYRGRDMDIPVISAKVGNQQKQVTLSTLFGKEHPFVVDRESGNYAKGSRYQINNLVEWTPELQGTTCARNCVVMAAVQDTMEIISVIRWGHFEGG